MIGWSLLYDLVWMDNWLGTPLIDQVREHSVSQPLLQAQVGDVYSDLGRWDLPLSLIPHFQFSLLRLRALW